MREMLADEEENEQSGIGIGGEKCIEDIEVVEGDRLVGAAEHSCNLFVVWWVAVDNLRVYMGQEDFVVGGYTVVGQEVRVVVSRSVEDYI